MPQFGKRSMDNLVTCHDDLQILFSEVVVDFDCSVICGHRTKEDQDAAFNAKPQRSKVQWPNSKHNQIPSIAADVIPYPVDWEDHRRFYMFVGIVRAYAARLYARGDMQYKIRCGADWDGDMEVKDQNFHDLPHVELIIP